MPARNGALFPVKGTAFEDCFIEIRGRRPYARVLFDLYRCNYDLTPDAGKDLGEHIREYVQQWADEVKAKRAPWPRGGVGWASSPTSLVDWPMLRVDLQINCAFLWAFLRGPDRLVDIRLRHRRNLVEHT